MLSLFFLKRLRRSLVDETLIQVSLQQSFCCFCLAVKWPGASALVKQAGHDTASLCGASRTDFQSLLGACPVP